MIDPQLLKTNIEAIEENIRKRDLDIDLDKLKLLDESRRTLKFESEKLRAEQKKLGKEIASASEKEKVILLEKAEKISDKVKSLSEETQQKDEEFFDAWIKIPNIVNSSSPVGKTDEDNKEIKKVGEPKDIKNPMTHLEIGENLGLIDVERASKISGSRLSLIHI
mgnify:CR=1 FL=1